MPCRGSWKALSSAGALAMVQLAKLPEADRQHAINAGVRGRTAAIPTLEGRRILEVEGC